MTLQLPRERLATRLFFLLLLIYALLRAWFVAPMHDEVATYFHYIETGKIWGDGALKDANNHLINSWLGRMSYLVFGTHFFIFRLPSIIAFCGYFFATKALVKSFHLSSWGQVLTFIALNTVPWMFDYFSYTRGYGMALSCFAISLYYLTRYLATGTNRFFILLLIVLWLMVASNLTYLITSLLVICYVGCYFLIHFKSYSRQQKIVHFAAVALFVFALFPLINYSFELKEAGALYYGSLDGIWWVTGKSIARIVLFYDANWLRYLFGILGLIVIGMSVNHLLKSEKTTWFKQPIVWLLFLIIGNIFAILFLAKVLHVNYPEDRAAMYFVPLLMCTGAICVNWYKLTQPLLALLLFFPFSFLLKMNLSTSVFSPDDRMPEEFYRTVKKSIHDQSTVAVYPIMQLTYALHERNHLGIKHVAQLQRNFEPYHDIILTKTTFLFPSDHWRQYYSVIATDPASTYIALKRKKAWVIKPLFDTLTTVKPSNLEFIPIYSGNIPKDWHAVTLRCDLNAQVFCEKNQNNMNLVVSTNDANGQNVRYDYQNLRWYQGAQKSQFSMHLPYLFKKLTASESQIVIYIWNPERKKIGLTRSHVQFSALN
jgi:hypothetical protein